MLRHGLLSSEGRTGGPRETSTLWALHWCQAMAATPAEGRVKLGEALRYGAEKSEVPLGGLRVTPSALGLTSGSRQRCVWLQRGRATCPDTDPLGLLKSEEGELRGIPWDSRPHPVPASSCLLSWTPGAQQQRKPRPPPSWHLPLNGEKQTTAMANGAPEKK